MDPVVTRFPPSPTGYLHIGGARTALFNWLFARHHHGKFILRIEDTDVARSTDASIKAILDAMEWLGLYWDDGPYFQTKRLPFYQDYLQRLLDSGKAYYCNCTPESLERRRQAALAAGKKPKYDGLCRDRGLGPGPDRVVRFRCPDVGTTVLNDLIKGPIFFDNAELDDLVLQRSDGMPTYNFAVVVDDITMNVTHVIRGDDHVNNTPRQILIYQALGTPLPQFGHVPMILGEDRTRMSKRHGATSVMAYKDMGFLPEAMVNYLVRLGWSYGDQEIFHLEELVEKFSLEHVGKSAGVFNQEKLLWINAHHIKERSPESLVPLLEPFLMERGYPRKPAAYLSKAIRTLQARARTLVEMADSMRFYMVENMEYDSDAAKKFLVPTLRAPFQRLMESMERLENFDEASLENVFSEVVAGLGMKLGKLAQPVRVALTGGTVSPGLFEIMDVLGKQTVLKRLGRALEYLNAV
ncbi:MAG: glutamate--tRNA ligase [Deltaproteobacteria bacterium]|nr:glutamate--tRNA ligase [Deltaproteobacteria bacterium]